MIVHKIGFVLLASLLISAGVLTYHTGDSLYSQLDDTATAIELDFATYIGGRQSDDVSDVAIDAEGYIYIAGTTGSTDFPTTEGAFDRSHNGGFELDPMDCFVMKLSPDGQEIIYSTFIGGSGDDYARELTVDALGNVYLCGETYSSNFPIYTAYDDSYNSDVDCFVLKLSADGSELLFSTYVGGSGYEFPYGIATNVHGDCYVIGVTESHNFPVYTLNNQTLCHGLDGERDAFVFKLCSNGSSLDYSMYLGGTYYPDDPYDIVLDSQDNPIIVGFTRSSDFPTVNAQQDELNGVGDGYIVRLDAEGRFSFSTYHGGSDADSVEAVKLDGNDQIYISGSTVSTDYPIVGMNSTILNGTKGVFLTVFDTNCTSIQFSGVLKDSYKEGLLTGVSSLVLVSEREVWVAGGTTNQDFPITEDAFDSRLKSNEAYVTMIDPFSSTVNYSTFYGGGDYDSLKGLIMDDSGRLIGVGSTRSSDFQVKDALYDSINDIGDYSDGYIFSLTIGGSEQIFDEMTATVAVVGAGITVVVIIAVFVRHRRGTV
ncbi:MAG: SBBP repeat-containing protein [Candidatus Thorarchaeota archaeon]